MARLTAAKRKKLPTSEFALPGKRAYPIDTPNRARNALSRSSQFASPSEQATIKRKVHSEYPGIAVSGMRGSNSSMHSSSRNSGYSGRVPMVKSKSHRASSRSV